MKKKKILLKTLWEKEKMLVTSILLTYKKRLKTLWEKEKMLVTSISKIYKKRLKTLWEKEKMLVNILSLIVFSFQPHFFFFRMQMLSIWTSLKICCLVLELMHLQKSIDTDLTVLTWTKDNCGEHPAYLKKKL